MEWIAVIGTGVAVLGIISLLILIFLVLSIALICYCNSKYEPLEGEEDSNGT